MQVIGSSISINNERTTKISPDEKREMHVINKKNFEEPIITPSFETLENRNKTIEELLKSGIVNLNKPMGPTSHQVSSWVKSIFGLKKVGHGGTLDPRVTGVLPLAFEASARLLSVLTYSTKEYVGIMRLHNDVIFKKIKMVGKEFEGEIYQMPPLRSAVKRQLRVRTIYSLDILEQNKRDVLFKVVCEAGTYIRTLINDLGVALGTGAHMQELRRVRSGPFHERDSVTLQELKDALIIWREDQNEALLKKYIKPVETLLLDLPKLIIQDTAVDAVCHGADLAIPGIIQFEDIRRHGQPVGLFTRKGEGIAIGKAMMLTNDILKTKSGIAVKTERVMMDPGTYQKGWKSKESYK